jgi:tRNA-splicing endonuclease subunit Sen2
VRAKIAEQKRNATATAKPSIEQQVAIDSILDEPSVQGSSTAGRPSRANASSNTERNSLPGSPANTGVEVEDMEHLQLTLHEAFFLSWALCCLEILHPSTVRYSSTLISLPPKILLLTIQGVYLSREDIWRAFLISSSTLPYPLLKSFPEADAERLWKRPDNPFLVNYVAYHHFRSLGWVVKSGIKFCVDLLLYKKGPVFAHAEYVYLIYRNKSACRLRYFAFPRFSIVVCPVYEDPIDRESSPFDLPNITPFTWSWLSTLNRVNTQVRKVRFLDCLIRNVCSGGTECKTSLIHSL